MSAEEYLTDFANRVIEDACASVGCPMRDGETFAEWFERARAPKLGDGRDYGLMPPPTTDRQALDWLAWKALPKDWCVIDPMNREQVNTCMAADIAKRLCGREGCLLRKAPSVGSDDLMR